MTFSKPRASRMATHTASNISCAPERVLSWEETRSRCSTAARWRTLSSALCACSIATAAWAATAPRTSS